MFAKGNFVRHNFEKMRDGMAPLSHLSWVMLECYSSEVTNRYLLISSYIASYWNSAPRFRESNELTHKSYTILSLT